MSSEQFVVFATPALDHNVTMGYFASSYHTVIELDKRNIAHGWHMLGGDPYLAKVRNLLVENALRNYPAMTDFFFLDADLEWDPMGVVKLLEAPWDVCCGVYPKKNDALEFPIELDYSGDQLHEMAGWYRAIHVPTGFLRIKRHVLEKIGADAFLYDDGTGNTKDVKNIFEMGFAADPQSNDPKRGKWWGEDYAWSEKWRAMGGEIWCWPDIRFGHRGGKTWRGNFNDSIAAFNAGSTPLVNTDEPETRSAA